MIMGIVIGLFVFIAINFGIYYLFKLWKDYYYYKNQAEILSYYKTFGKKQLEEMYKKLSEEELATNKLQKHYQAKLNINEAIKLIDMNKFDVMTQKERLNKFAEEVIYSLRNSDGNTS